MLETDVICVSACMRAYMGACMHAYMGAFVRMYVRAIYIYIYIYARSLSSTNDNNIFILITTFLYLTCFFSHRGIIISKNENLHQSLYKIPKGIKLLLINKYKCCLKIELFNNTNHKRK